MRSSSNPAFRNLPTQGGGYATFDRQGGAMGGAAAYADAQAAEVGYGRAGVGERPLTMDDVVTKTAITGALALATGVLTALSGQYWLVLPAFIVGLVVSLIVIFKQSSNPGLVLTYSAAMGVALGGITGALENIPNFEGIGFQAVVGTAGVFVGMLVVYKTGAVRVTPRFTKWLIGAHVRRRHPDDREPGGQLLHHRRPGPARRLAARVLFSIVCIGVAAFSLLLDFDMADRAVRDGAPARFAWYIAFGLMTTLVWLYIEILRLLSYFRQE